MTWPIYDEPYEVCDGFRTYTEVIVAGADEGAQELPEPRTMIVEKCEWNADFSLRRITKLRGVGREP